MASPYRDGIVKRLNFGPDIPTPLSFTSGRRGGGWARTPAAPSVPSTPGPPGSAHSGVVRYGLPEEELRGTERRTVSQSRSYRIPSDDECDTDDDATSAAAPVPAVSRPDAVEEQRRLLQQQMEASLETLKQSKQESWRERLAEVEAQLSAKLSLVATAAQRKQDDLLRGDQEQLRQQQARRQEVLQRVSRSHATEASMQEQQIKRLMEQREEERRKEEERRRREREEEERRRERERQEAEKERQRKEEEERQARERKAKEEADKEAERVRQTAEEEADKQRQEAEAKSKKAAAATGAGAHPCLRVSPAAQEQAAQLAARLAEAQAALQPLLEDEGAKKQRRDIEKKMTVHVQQICGTQNQVMVKCQDVYTLLNGLQGVWRTFGVMTLCRKIISQHGLVQQNNKAAFPLALVVVKVSQVVPELMELLLALLHKACPLAVPRAYVHDPARITNNAYYRGMGFEELDDPSAPAGKVFESPDEYASRLEGLMLLYGAIMQADDPNRHGVAHAWSYLARCLNHLPPDRYSAKALIAVLRVAGYALHVRYRGQFTKLLAAMQREYLPGLRATAGDDIGALATVLESYVTDGVFRRPPEGRNMPTFDISSMEGNRA
ncbi:hypothetical protein Agub_g14660 [Astrephomene gubernaculifera]|uniref:mRNA export factor GLE1 n=1 Tax=Astrephomene gubernaculifera TaxID=47775 RepID=A0AAD3HTL9_9CHLO|nr:hypothetical protein Agub_g14660 [Astrephomene gubernaculifera]